MPDIIYIECSACGSSIALYGQREAAEMTGLSPKSITAYALKYEIGIKFRDRWYFTDEHLGIIRAHRERGRGKAKCR